MNSKGLDAADIWSTKALHCRSETHEQRFITILGAVRQKTAAKKADRYKLLFDPNGCLSGASERSIVGDLIQKESTSSISTCRLSTAKLQQVAAFHRVPWLCFHMKYITAMFSKLDNVSTEATLKGCSVDRGKIISLYNLLCYDL